MDRRFHQSIKKHLPHTQHDLYLVNRIVSLYPYIIIALIPLAICLMLFLRLTSRSREIEGGLVQYWPENRASFWECCRSEQPEDSGHWLLIGCCNPTDLILSLFPFYCCGIQLYDPLCQTHISVYSSAPQAVQLWPFKMKQLWVKQSFWCKLPCGLFLSAGVRIQILPAAQILIQFIFQW